MRTRIWLLLLMGGFPMLGFSQTELNFSGKVTDMQGFFRQNQHYTFNQFQQRFELEAHLLPSVQVHLGLRNRILSGPLLRKNPTYATLFEYDSGLLDLTKNTITQPDYFMNTALDRLYGAFTFKNWELRVGRQRINWGIGLVWNPNDLFNSYSYMDFDYQERPGSDAVSLTCYTSDNAALDLAIKLDSNRQVTAAMRYFFNQHDIDWQLLAGKVGRDWMAGGGWSGNIQDLAFRGEVSVYSDKTLVGTLDVDRALPGEWYLHAACIFNNHASYNRSYAPLSNGASLDPKRLSFGKFGGFGLVSHSFSPIFKSSLAGMYNFQDHAYYLSPSIDVSLTDNLNALFLGQILNGSAFSANGGSSTLYAVYARIAWSF